MEIMARFKNKAKSFILFEIGNSFILYYLFIFCLASILAVIGNLTGRFGIIAGEYSINYFAFFYLICGLIFFAIGYYCRRTFFVAGRISDFLKLKSEWDFKKVPWIFGAAFISGLAIKILRIFGGAYAYWQQNSWLEKSSFYSLLGIFDWLSYVAFIIAFLIYFHFKKNNDVRCHLWQKIAWLTFALEMLYALPSCNRTAMITPIILYLILRSYILNISWKRIIIVILGIIIIIFPLGNICRNPAILPYYLNQKSDKKDVVNYEVVKNIKNLGKLTFNSIFSRLDQSVVFSKIVEMDEPLLYGKSLLNFFISLGPPRFIWHNKPIISGGGDFGHRSGLLAPSVKSTVGVTIIGDLYMNFRLMGIIVGMFIFGILFRLIYEILIKKTNSSFSGVMIYTIVWLMIIKGMEDWIAPVYAGLVKTFLMLLLIHYFLIKRGGNDSNFYDFKK